LLEFDARRTIAIVAISPIGYAGDPRTSSANRAAVTLSRQKLQEARDALDAHEREVRETVARVRRASEDESGS
jgi:hypothetical protein